MSFPSSYLPLRSRLRRRFETDVASSSPSSLLPPPLLRLHRRRQSHHRTTSSPFARIRLRRIHLPRRPHPNHRRPRLHHGRRSSSRHPSPSRRLSLFVQPFPLRPSLLPPSLRSSTSNSSSSLAQSPSCPPERNRRTRATSTTRVQREVSQYGVEENGVHRLGT